MLVSVVEEDFMNKEELSMRLEILHEQNVINNRAYEVTFSAFENLTETLEMNDIKQAEMLFTHLPTALTRISQGENVEEVSDGMLTEIKQSPLYPLAKEQVDYVVEMWGNPLPQAEIDYLLLHYTTVMTLNRGGK